MFVMVVWLDACRSGPRIGSQSVVPIEKIKAAFHGEHVDRVRFQGVVTVENLNFGFFVVQDSTAGIRVQPSRFIENSLIGHRVDIVGSLPAGYDTETISDASVRDLGSANMPAPVKIAARELQADTFDGKLVSLAGIARAGFVDGGGQLVIPLRVDGFEVPVRFMNDWGMSGEQFADAEIRVTGVASTGVDLKGKLIDLTILAWDAKAIQLLRGPPDPQSLPVQSLKSILDSPGAPPERRVRLQGRIENPGDAEGLRFSDSSASVVISDAGGFDPRLAGRLDVVAFVNRGSGAWTLSNVRPTFAANAAATQVKSAAITTVAELHGLSAEDAGRRRQVLLDCVLTYYDPTWQMAFVQDRSGGVYVSMHGIGNLPPLRAGDRVRLRGLSGAGDFAPIVQTPTFEFVEHASLPPPATTTAEMIFSGQADSQWVELEGIVQSLGFEGNHPSAKLSYGSHNYKILFPSSVVLTPEWIDARLKVRGAAGTLFNGRRQVLGIQLFVQGLDQLQRLPDPASSGVAGAAQITVINQLLQFHPNEVPGHRVHLRGKVLATNRLGPTWIKDDSGAVAIREHNEISLTGGDLVDVVGFAVAGAFSADIHEGVITKLSSAAPVRPIDVTPERALFQGVDGQLVKLEGRLISEHQNGREQSLFLRNGKATFTVRGMGNLPAYEIGAVLRFTGICTVSAKQFRGVLVPNSFEIAVDSPAAVEVIEKAPWLTQQRAWRALFVTSLLIAATMVWVMMLRRRVSGQTRLIEQKLLEVEKLKAKAEAASDAKSQFLANMSHEIRTPMNGILGMTELAMQAESAEEQRECLSTIRSSGDSLLSILNDLLDLSKIEAGKFEIGRAPFSLRELVKESGKVFAFRIKEKGLHFESSVAESLPDLLMGDALRLRQILLNLLGNAVKFTQEGTIALTAAGERDGDKVQLRLAVRDSVIGITPERQSRIFDAFHQADESIAQKYGGTGLGLSICLKLVTLMGGVIEVASELGKGSTFSVVVPLLVLPEEPRNLGESCVVPQTVVAPLSILVAEDNPVNQKVAARLLEKQGHRVTIAENGKIALEEFQRGSFDLILMDIQMPEMDGLEAASNIRRIEQTRKTRIPIIAMTAQTMTGDRDNCFAAGMDGFVSKPIRLPELWTAIATVKTPATW